MNLLPCPFCGSDAKLSYSRGNENINQSWAVKCTKCACYGQSFTGTNTWEGYSKAKEQADMQAEQNAIDWWNRRASPEPLTDDDLARIRLDENGSLLFVSLREFIVIARAIEKAHGIAQGELF